MKKIAGFAWIIGAGAWLAAGASRAGEPAKLPVMGENYPRAFFFRASENISPRLFRTYEEWDGTFSRLMGLMGKTLEEEVPGRSANIDFFTRFKKAHPDQAVLLHYNGNARDPRDQGGKFFAGHWVYHNGAKILSDVPAEEGETDIRVSDARLFQVNAGRYLTSNDDVGLCEMDEAGRPDWRRSEQVQLVSVDGKGGTIRVRRGCYDTKPRAFPAGAYAAAHVAEGPWGKKSHLLWFYNYSTTCPRDERGRTCADVLTEDLWGLFKPGGRLAAYDGLEFDVLGFRVGGGRGPRGPDCDADGKADGGIANGRNEYGIGVVEFCRQLRRRFGDDRLIMADGYSLHNQRAFGLLNGIESEGWPALSDWTITDWSGGLNRHFYWDRFARPPKINYINHKFNEPTGEPGEHQAPDIPFSTHRLVLAAAQFTDAAVCYSFPPRPERGEKYGIWDELRMGSENRLGWLGRPLAPAVRLATRRTDVLGGMAAPFTEETLARLSGADVKFSLDSGRLKVESSRPDAAEIRFRQAGVPCDGPDLFVAMTARGETMRGYPVEVTRLTYVRAGSGEMLSTLTNPPTGMGVRGRDEADIAPDSGAFVRWNRAIRLSGTSHSGYQVHPPFKAVKGYVFWTQDVSVPAGGRLIFYTGMSESAAEKSDGVAFRLDVAELKDGRTGTFERVFDESQVAGEWKIRSVSLARWAGRAVRLKFIADCGPKNNATRDFAMWGDVCLLSGEKGEPTPYRGFMTWLGREDFESGFYFSHLKFGRADLEFVVEGGEPVWISRLSAHAHPDATFREFENGLVLANPADRPYEFDLAALLPGRSYRRIQGSSRQDTQANNGRPVPDKLTLGPKDAIFLVRRSSEGK